jgi:superfamily I DNA/RNA helicase
MTIELAEALADAAPGQLRGSGRGNVLYRLGRLRELRRALGSTDDPQALVDYVFNPEKWVVDNWEDAALAREDIQRLNREAVKLLEGMTAPSPAKLVRALRYQIATREPLGAEEIHGVRIVTLWGAKGLTADYAYIVGLCDEALPGPHKPESTGLEPGEHLDEQRRLLYVSLTRAKKVLVLSRPTKIKRGNVPALGLTPTNHGNRFWQELRPSRFLKDVPRRVLPDSVPSEQWSGVELRAH